MAHQRNTEEAVIWDRVVEWIVSYFSLEQSVTRWLSRGQLKLQPLDCIRGQSSFTKLVLLRAALESASLGLLVILTSLAISIPIANCAI